MGNPVVFTFSQRVSFDVFVSRRGHAEEKMRLGTTERSFGGWGGELDPMLGVSGGRVGPCRSPDEVGHLLLRIWVARRKGVIGREDILSEEEIRTVSDYAEFLKRKSTTAVPTGLEVVPDLGEHLFPFQRDLVSWALRRGRAAIFADTGLGKTRKQLIWAREIVKATGRDVLILAPLAVTAQTAAEGARIGVDVTQARDGDDVRPGISITNYERLHRFNVSRFIGVVLDESSCIKHHDAKTFALLLEAFRTTPYKLCATATPAPNDYTELGTHAEFLGIRSQTEMLAEFFVHDGGETQKWRLKGHARKEFWRWVSSWGALVRKPSDLGYDDSAYILPPLRLHHHVVASDNTEAQARGLLFAMEAQTLQERREARRATTMTRAQACADIVNTEANEPWVVWCDLNMEGDALRKLIPGSVEIRGSDTPEDKEARLIAFARGEFRVLISKSSICGFGLNWQHAARMAFVGVTDSFEAYYQAVRRCWRFGQTRPVEVHIFASEAEGAVIANLARKEADARAMSEQLSAETKDAVMAAVRGARKETNEYKPTKPMQVPSWLRGAA